MERPRILRISASERVQQVGPPKRISPWMIFPGRVGDEPHDGKGRDALAASRFADDPEGAPFLQLQVHAVHGLGYPFIREEVGVKVSDFQKEMIFASHKECYFDERGLKVEDLK